jgi:hypothetical protein
MNDNHRYVLVLEPLPRVDGEQALRRALKALLRAYGLRCVKASTTTAEEASTTGTEAKP